MSADPHRALIRALAAQLGPIHAMTAKTRDWASVMFIGMRHNLTLTLDDTPSTLATLAGLYEADLPLRGHFVADLVVSPLGAENGLVTVEIEALTIEEN
jgi:hypothetical protein